MTALTVLAGYVVTSLILFRFPNLIYKKKNLKFKCRHISHRGGAGENLENTMAAYEHSVSLGTEMLEIDLQLTRDGEIVISHDDNLQRSAGENINISDTNYKNLPLLKTELPIDFDPGKLFRAKPNCDRRIPLLRELFERFPTLPINIDIKKDNDLLITKVSNLIKEFNREEYTVWGNFSDKIVKKCYKENPYIITLFSAKGVFKILIFTYTGLLPFIPFKERCFEIFMPSIFLKKDSSLMSDRALLKTLMWVVDKLLLRKSIIQHLERRGIHTYIWVANYEEDFKRAFEIGATGVMTDYPTKLRKFLDENPHLIKN